uniref:Uncharacterized protein n=1 Tax=Arundo donax TaxID=35708 RepID=A0A0A9D7G3_ARUDO
MGLQSLLQKILLLIMSNRINMRSRIISALSRSHQSTRLRHTLWCLVPRVLRLFLVFRLSRHLITIIQQMSIKINCGFNICIPPGERPSM